MIDFFYRVSGAITRAVGTPYALVVAFGVIVLWLVSGPAFHFSDTWQLVINTGTTIVTFLMVFLIQATQNREAKVTQLKLDELIRAAEGARNSLIALEEAGEAQVERRVTEMRKVANNADERALEKIEIMEQAGDHATARGKTSARGSSTRAAARTVKRRRRNGTAPSRNGSNTAKKPPEKQAAAT
ncbi:MAG: low affinity iron permease family protein [Chloroflexota bacterium]